MRGHSNVQGQRTVGITEKPELVPLDRLAEQYGFNPPRERGLDTVGTCEAVRDGSVKAFISLGGNFIRAIPETDIMERAWRQLEMAVQIATKLNRGALIHGRAAYLLPCLGRIEIDRQTSGVQFVTVEDTTGRFHASHGQAEPAGEHILSRPGAQRGLCHAAELGAGGTTRCLHRHPVDHRRHIACEAGGIGFGSKVACRSAPFQPLADQGHAGIAPRGKFGLNRIALLPAAQSSLHDETAGRIALIAQTLSGAMEQTLNGFKCGGSVQGLFPERRVARLVAIERLAEQTFLVPEGGVQTWRVDTHGLGQIRHRSPFIALAPEHFECLIQRRVDVEAARASKRHTSSGPSLFHIDHYISDLTAVVQASICSVHYIIIGVGRMAKSLTGKVALVTGGSRGIGAAIVLADKPEEVAAAVVFLAKPEAGYITGTTWNVDGGLRA